MTLSEKIMSLRKQKGWSQEDLADQLGISRQSVSKWESASASPDLDKIVRMSQIFGVTTDWLLTDTEAQTHGEPSEPVSKVVTREEADQFLAYAEAEAKPMAFAVSALILSPAPLILLSGLQERFPAAISESMAGGLGVAVLLLIAALALFVLIRRGMSMSRYDYLEEERIFLQSGVSTAIRQKQESFAPTFRNAIATGVLLCIVGIIPLVTASAFDAADLVYILCVDVLLALVACGVWQFVWAGSIHESYEKLLQEGDYTPEEKEANKKIGAIYWPAVVAVYLAVSFLTMRWDKTWVIWPCAGVLYAAVIGFVKIRSK